MKVFVARIDNQLDLLSAIPWSAKFGGATGNFNAHYVAYPEVDWNSFADAFLKNPRGIAVYKDLNERESLEILKPTHRWRRG